MLHQFLTDHRPELIDRCNAKVALRPSPRMTEATLEYGIPIFLDQLIKTLEVEQSVKPSLGEKVSGPSGGQHSGTSELGETAAQHGRELLRHGFSIDQVVHNYGDLCQAITELAFERKAPIEVDEFRTLNRCLDNAIADAVTEYDYQRSAVVADLAHKESHAINERLGFFTHELRNLVTTATLAVSAIKAGKVGLSGATGAVLDRSLVGLRHLIDRSLIDVRMTAGLPVQHRLFSLAEFIAEVTLAASLEAQVRNCVLTATPVNPELAVDADRELLASAVGNLLQNAFKFTHRHTEVILSAYAVADRIRIDVEDHCGGLPAGFAKTMFQPFVQGSEDRSGLGLGLSISQRSVEANGGQLSVTDVPGSGCIFTIELPRHAAPQPALAAERPG